MSHGQKPIDRENIIAGKLVSRRYLGKEIREDVRVLFVNGSVCSLEHRMELFLRVHQQLLEVVCGGTHRDKKKYYDNLLFCLFDLFNTLKETSTERILTANCSNYHSN